MQINESKLEKWILKIPECEIFLRNFFESCGNIDAISNFVNYYNDILGYGLIYTFMRDNYYNLLNAFEEICELKIYDEDGFENPFLKK